MVEAPEEALSAAQITRQPNVEVRRVMLERYGADRYLREADGELVAEDDFGRLWRAELSGDEALSMVEVVNSSAEPDGSHKTYYLRVPPHCDSARAAVAWTFDTEPDSYAPAVET